MSWNAVEVKCFLIELSKKQLMLGIQSLADVKSAFLKSGIQTDTLNCPNRFRVLINMSKE